MSPILFQLILATSKITDTTIDRIFSFKCLSLIFTPMHSSSSSSRIFYSTRKKAKNQFYIRCSSSTLLTLCKLLIHPILEFTAVIWDSTSHTNPSLLLIYYLISQRKKKEPCKIIQVSSYITNSTWHTPPLNQTHLLSISPITSPVTTSNQ